MTITYYFSVLSPWAYIGHAELVRIVREHGLTLDVRPVNLGEVFPNSGGLPLAKRHPSRQRYRMLELQRWRDKRGLAFDLEPAHWPFAVGLADRLVIAVADAGHDPMPLVGAMFDAIWREGRDLADRGTLAALLAAQGLDAGLLEAADGPGPAATYARNLEQALETGVFGSPCYLREGEVFWGQDRLDLLEDALKSGRAPFSPDP